MTFGLTIEKLLLIGVIAVVIIGPERLPAAAESLRAFLTQARRLARSAQEHVRDELGPEVSDVDWQRLDPRRYDPRRILREALFAEPDVPAASSAPPSSATDHAGGTEAPVPAATGQRVPATPPSAGE
ncbi:twin-arginine translocase TatA/TatE family subunit [Microbacterium sp. NPDC089188]|uniref:twin-arginine translocase TatA/TatE family subunit n=1 Tax=Microbacterium sp. NPDC089188 TaxID=3154971 RepID=UPI00341D04B8